MNKWALITGASSGIGREFARVFAADGWHVALTARDRARLDSLAAELQQRHRVGTQVLQADLSVPGAAKELFDRLRDTPISALVNNAGLGQQGPFAQLSSHTAMMQVNMVALVELTHLFLKPMLERREGRILNVASVAAFQPGPFLTLYYASKAFVYSFSCGLAEELRGSGVTVTVLCPGSTRTEFHARAGMRETGKWFPVMDAHRVAVAGYRAMMRGKPIVIPGAVYKIVSALSKASPTMLAARAARKHIEG